MSAQPSEPSFQSPEQASFQGAEQYLRLMHGMQEIDLTAAEKPISREEFLIQASDMKRGIQERIDSGQTKGEALAYAYESYVNDAEDPRMGLQAWVLINAPVAENNQRILNDLKGRQASDPRARKALKRELIDRKRAACSFNQEVRRLVLSSPDSFSRDDLTNWLERWSGGNNMWAHQLVGGVAAEVAVARAAQHLPGFKVELGTLEDDVKGADFILVGPNGSRVRVDVKSGGHQPLDQVAIGRSNVQVGVERSDIEGFSIVAHKRTEVLTRLKSAF